MFECDKTAIIHFTRTARRLSQRPPVIKGETVRPKESQDAGRSPGHRAEVQAARGGCKWPVRSDATEEASGIVPRVARQLFTPAMDYASNVWAHFCGEKGALWLIQGQAIGVEAVTRAFRSVTAAVAEAEAGIMSALDRHAKAAAKTWINLSTLPRAQQLAGLSMRICRRFTSPLQKMVVLFREVGGERLEMWAHRFCVVYDANRDKATPDRSRPVAYPSIP